MTALGQALWAVVSDGLPWCQQSALPWVVPILGMMPYPGMVHCPGVSGLWSVAGGDALPWDGGLPWHRSSCLESLRRLRSSRSDQGCWVPGCGHPCCAGGVCLSHGMLCPWGWVGFLPHEHPSPVPAEPWQIPSGQLRLQCVCGFHCHSGGSSQLIFLLCNILPL